jgi:hypothetical protein
MRTTLDIDDRVLDTARSLARQKRISLGAAVSELALRGLRPQATDSPFPTFVVCDDADPVTAEMVREAMDEA